MTVATDDLAEMAPDRPAPVLNRTRPYYWSVRRELWENRSLHIAPLAVAAVALLGFMISTIGMPERRRGVLALDPVRQVIDVSQPYDFVAVAIIFTMGIVAVTYCLGALHGERRDRSVLFWKSLPISDLTTVLAKATVPFVVLPVIAIGVILAMQLLMLVWSFFVLLLSGVNPFTPLPLAQMAVVLVYGLVTQILWQAPVYGWLLLVSAWARRAPFLWAVLPPLALCMLEKVAFNTHYLATVLGHRLGGGHSEAFVTSTHLAVHKGTPHFPVLGVADLDPAKFLSSPALWVGLVICAACLAGCVWFRRRREPI